MKESRERGKHTLLVDHHPRHPHGRVCRHLHGAETSAFEAFNAELACAICLWIDE